ncbi:MAG: CinA family protein [Chloroflexia bacterium]
MVGEGEGETARSRTLGVLLRGEGLTIATAESCTGGSVAAALTAIAGSSAYFLGGAVTYSPASKAAVLGVPQAIIDGEGVVSAPCALAMAQGARRVFGADIAVATTGIAGPGGAEPGKPVGLVYIAVAWEDGAHIRHAVYPGDRAAVIGAAAREALALVLDHLHDAL